MRPSQLGEGYASRLRLQATDGTMVILLSPMLEDPIGTAAGTDPQIAEPAWRMRRPGTLDDVLRCLARDAEQPTLR